MYHDVCIMLFSACVLCISLQVNIALPLVFLTVCSFLVLLPFFVSPQESIIGAAITLSGIPVYFVTIYWESKPEMYKRVISEYLLLFLLFPFILFPKETTRNSDTHSVFLVSCFFSYPFLYRFSDKSSSEDVFKCRRGRKVLTNRSQKKKSLESYFILVCDLEKVSVSSSLFILF